MFSTSDIIVIATTLQERLKRSFLHKYLLFYYCEWQFSVRQHYADRKKFHEWLRCACL